MKKTLTNSDQLSLLYASYQPAFEEVIKTYQTPFDDMFKSVPSVGPSETYNFLLDFSSVTKVGKAVTNFVSNYSDVTFTVANEDYRGNFSVSRAEVRQQKEGRGAERAEGLARQMKRFKSELVVLALANAFNETKAFDGKPLIASDHDLNEGSTINNLITGALTPEKFEEAYERLDSFVITSIDDENIKLSLNQDMTNLVLIVNPAERAMARNIVEKDILASGESNMNKGLAKIKVSSMIPAGQWLLVNKNSDTPLFRIQSELEPTLRAVSSDNDYLFTAEASAGIVTGPYWAIVGSQG